MTITQNFLVETLCDPRTEMENALAAAAEGHAIEAAEAWGCAPDEATAAEERRVRAGSRFPVVAADPAPCSSSCLPF